MTPELTYRSRWLVMIGTHYVAGLGQTFQGYCNNEHVPVTPGIVITRQRTRAMEFTSRREASSLAKSLGGVVMRV